MKIRKLITTLTAAIALATAGTLVSTYHHQQTVSASSTGFKKSLPKEFKKSWIGDVKKSGSEHTANFIVRNGSKYAFATVYWDQNGKKEDSKSFQVVFNFKYSFNLSHNEYLITSNPNSKKSYTFIVKFAGKNKMAYSLAEFHKNGDVYPASDQFTVNAATKSAAEGAMNSDLRSSNSSDSSSTSNSSTDSTSTSTSSSSN